MLIELSQFEKELVNGAGNGELLKAPLHEDFLTFVKTQRGSFWLSLNEIISSQKEQPTFEIDINDPTNIW